MNELKAKLKVDSRIFEKGESYRYQWLDVAYLRWLDGETPNYENFKEFMKLAIALKNDGKLELAQSGRDTRERLAKQRGTLWLNRKMEKWQKLLMRENVTQCAYWLYRVLENEGE